MRSLKYARTHAQSQAWEWLGRQRQLTLWDSFIRLDLGWMGKAGGKTPSFQGTDLNLHPDWLSSPRTIGTQKRSWVEHWQTLGVGRSCRQTLDFSFSTKECFQIAQIIGLLNISWSGAVITSEDQRLKWFSQGELNVSSAQGFQAPASFGKSSEMRQSKEKVVLECGSLPAMSERTLLQRKNIAKESREWLSVLLLGSFCSFKTKSCVSQANIKPPVKVRPCSWSHTTWVAEAE